MKRLCLIFTFLVCLCSLAKAQEYRDVIFMKNGSVIKGFYKELYPDDSLRMKTIDGGLFICAISDIDRIAKEKNSVYLVDTENNYKHTDEEWRTRGYRCYIEYFNTYNVENNSYSSNGTIFTVGYLFNRYLFAGIGFGVQKDVYNGGGYVINYTKSTFPLLLKTRAYFLKKANTPYLELEAGHTFNNMNGNFFLPSIGYDFSFSPRFGLYIAVGYCLASYDMEGQDGREDSNSLCVGVGLHF